MTVINQSIYNAPCTEARATISLSQTEKECLKSTSTTYATEINHFLSVR